MSTVAGGLHLYFYTFAKQGQDLKYDPRPLMKSGKKFTLGGQIRDNMFWALANGYAPILTWAANPVWFIACCTCHFYTNTFTRCIIATSMLGLGLGYRCILLSI